MLQFFNDFDSDWLMNIICYLYYLRLLLFSKAHFIVRLNFRALIKLEELMIRGYDLDFVFHDDEPVERSSPYSTMYAPNTGGEKT